MGHALKFYDKVFYVMGEVLSGKLSFMPISLVLLKNSCENTFKVFM